MKGVKCDGPKASLPPRKLGSGAGAEAKTMAGISKGRDIISRMNKCFLFLTILLAISISHLAWALDADIRNSYKPLIKATPFNLRFCVKKCASLLSAKVVTKILEHFHKTILNDDKKSAKIKVREVKCY